MMKSRHKLALAAAGLLLIAGVVAVTLLTAEANYDAFSDDVARLDTEQRRVVDQLVAVETADMVRNEEKSVTYFHGQARTGEKNRVYLLWKVLAPDAASKAGPYPAGATETSAVVAFVDLGFHSFRTQHNMMLGGMIRARGPAVIRGSRYRWDPAASGWLRVGDASNEAVLRLISASQMRALRRGSYNMVDWSN